ncbi:MAG: ATP-binding protein [Bacteroidota bacterium]|nr:ATP-binding protein [Bacteroidota bacterium]
MKPLLLLLLAVLMDAVNLYSRNEIYFRHIDSNDGLSDNQVRGIFSAPDGRIMVRTVGMINFYDATTFKYSLFNAECTYKWNYKGFEVEYMDQEGRIWMKENGQLLLFDLKTNKFVYTISETLAKYGIKGILEDVFLDKDKNYWFLTQDKKLYYCQSNAEHTRRIAYTTERDERFEQILCLTQSGPYVYFLFKSGWIRVFDTKNSRFVKDIGFLAHKVTAETSRFMMKADAAGNLWVMFNGMSGGLFKFNPSSSDWQILLPSGDFYTSFDIDFQGTAWVGTRNGLWLIEPKRTPVKIGSFKLIEGGNLTNDINSVFADQQGGIWLGMFNQGILYYHPSILKFRQYNKKVLGSSFMLEEGVRCLLENASGTILVGTTRGLLEFNPVTEQIAVYSPYLRTAFCLQLIRDKAGRLWVSTLNDGLFCLDGKKVRNYRAGQVSDGIPDNNVRAFYENADGAFFISTMSGGFGQFYPETGRFQSLKKRFPAINQIRLITHIVPFRGDQMLVAGQNGLFVYYPKTGGIHFPSTGTSDRLFRHSNHKYNSIFKDSRGYIWFGTQVGLNVWCPTNQKLYSFYMEQGLSNNSIQTVLEDKNHDIWVSTSNGITRIKIRMKDKQPNFSFVNFNQQDGLIEGEFYERSALLTKNGTLYFGGVNGFNSVDPNHISFGVDKLVPIFVKLKLFNTEISGNETYDNKAILDQSITKTKKLTLAYNQNFITLEFSALNFINPTQTYYRYKLEGLDNVWTELQATDGTGRVTYTGLRPGKYRLKVFAANNSKNWSPHFAEMEIIIKAPFWATTFAYFVYILLGLTLIYIFIEWRFKENKRKFMRKQEEERRMEKEKLDQMKFRFFTNISHEFRTPLTLILTPLDSILKRLTDATLKKQLTTVYKSAQDLLDLVNQLLDFRRLEMKGEKLNLSYCDVMEFLDTIYYSFRDAAAEKGLAFNIEHHKANLCLYVDKDKLHKIMNNLLSNAFKFTPKDGVVTIRIGEDSPPSSLRSMSEFLRIDVADTGVGIPEKDLHNIFNRFYQADNFGDSNTGSGIGLHLVREYVRLHNGEVVVSSSLNKGSVFTLYFPLDLHPDTENQESISNDEATPEDTVLPKVDEKKFTLLLVEDNLEFRSFLAESLEEFYHVVVASDGQQGSEKVVHVLPDLVISDIMMPEVDGIELCRRIKTDIRTSHIPVILLTAKISEEYQFVGYEAGADAYIAKPFNMDILFLRIRKLIEQQESRKALFHKTIVVNPSSIAITSLDEKLVQKALDCVEKNMDNPEYSVEELSEEIGMNRTQLYRKLQSIVGMTPSDFIRSIRLKRAAQLLEKSQFNVAEVADMVGFNTQKYFSKYFKEMFGVKPSQYGREKKDE